MSYINNPSPGGSGGSGNFAQGLVDFGHPSGLEGDTAAVTIAAPWVSGSSIVVASLQALATPDHDPDDYMVEGLVGYAANIVPGIGFDIIVYAPSGSWGRYYVSAVGN